MNQRGGLTTSRVLFAIFAAHMLASLAICALRFIGGRSPPLLFIVSSASLGLSQAALVGLWLGFGKTPWKTRWAIAGVGLIAIWASFSYAVRGPRMLTWRVTNLDVVFIVCDAFAVTVLVCLLRRAGLALKRHTPSPPDAASARMQFTIVDILLFTTVAALALVAVRLTRTYIIPNRQVDAFGLYMLQIACASLCSTWAALSRRRVHWRLPAAPIVLAVALPAYYIERQWELPVIVIGQAAVTAVTLLAFRWTGYRLCIVKRMWIGADALDVPIEADLGRL